VPNGPHPIAAGIEAVARRILPKVEALIDRTRRRERSISPVCGGERPLFGSFRKWINSRLAQERSMNRRPRQLAAFILMNETPFHSPAGRIGPADIERFLRLPQAMRAVEDRQSKPLRHTSVVFSNVAFLGHDID
jgi:hypothetical protein